MLPQLNDNEDNPTRLWAEIHKLRAEAKGPDGFDTWQDAAVAERQRRVKLQAEVEKLTSHLVKVLDGTWVYVHTHCTIQSIKEDVRSARAFLKGLTQTQ